MEAPKGGRFKREIGWFSAFSMGFGDVGADVFIALGVTMLYGRGLFHRLRSHGDSLCSD